MTLLRRLLVAAAAAATLLVLPLSTPAESANDRRYVVVLSGAPLAAYGGGVAGLAATDPTVTGARELDADSAASRAYLAHLRTQQDDAIARASAAIGRRIDIVFRYSATLNAFAAVLSDAEAAAVAQLPGVAKVHPDAERELLTDNGPAWIGAPAVWSGSAGAGTRGAGVVVGVIDTGINTDHPSFAEVGPVDGHRHTNPRGRYFGVCDPATGLPSCNDKLIGVYDFTPAGTGEDENGHGSHTASTAAGNVLDAALVAPTMTLNRRISGVAPHANVISYKACVGLTAPAGECLLTALLAAIDQATLDEVDVVNFSIGGGPGDPWADPDSLAFLNARRAGLFVAASAGNDGPGPGTVGSPANSPWLLSVAASTHDRNLPNGVDGLTGGATPPPWPSVEGKSLTTGYGPARIVYAGAPPYNNALCGAGTAAADGSSEINPFPPGTFNGEIVVCERGTYGRVAKGQNVKDGGAGGMILLNDALNGDSLVGDAHVLPAVHISYANGELLKRWLAAGTGHTGTIRGTRLDVRPENGDITASFSSRGPNVAPSVVKPDITAPGVDILAAFNNGATPVAPEYGVISGTSMSSPHMAGAGALLRALHPSWTPDEIKSALMTTAFHGAAVRKEDASTPADPFDVGAGRVAVANAARAGLVLDESPTDYVTANPSAGGDPRTLNLPSLADAKCAGACSWTRVVRSTAAAPVTWTTSGSGSGGLVVTVAPKTFTLNPGQTRTIIVTADTSDVRSEWAFGRVNLASNVAGVPTASLPVAARADAAVPAQPRLALHFHGNASATGADHDSGHAWEGDCTGDGKTDLTACRGPFLLKSDALSPSPAGWWTGGPAEWALDGAHDRTIYDPNWIWCLRKNDPAKPTETQCPEAESPAQGPTTLEGPMTVDWWVQCAATCGLGATNWEIALFADGVNVVTQQVQAGAAPLGTPARLTATVNVPRVTANHRFTLHIEPVYLVDQGATFLFQYDSSQPCAATTADPCDSVVHMPVVSSGGTTNAAPDAVGDTATVARGQSATIAVLANDTDADGDSLSVTSTTNGTHGAVAKNPDGTLTYTQSGGPTAADSFTYTVSDGKGGTDSATVNVTVTGPDLAVTDVVVERANGNRQTVKATVANTGTADAPATATRFSVGGSALGTAATPAVARGQSVVVSVPWSTADVTGEHQVTATADDGAAALETNEGNNSATRTVTVKGNKVQNGSFEQSSNGTTPDNWTGSGSTTYEQGGSDGERSAGAGPGGTWTSDPIAVDPAKTYDLEVDVSGAVGGVAVQQLSATGAVLSTATIPVSALTAGAFSVVSGAVTTVPDAAALRVRLSGPVLGTTRFDAVELYER